MFFKVTEHKKKKKIKERFHGVIDDLDKKLRLMIYKYINRWVKAHADGAW